MFLIDLPTSLFSVFEWKQTSVCMVYFFDKAVTEEAR